MAAVHHAVELGLNACGVECCPHAPYRRLVAVASYLHQPGDDDQPQSRVGQLFLYNLAPAAGADAADEVGGDKNGDRDGDVDKAAGWTFAPAAPPLDTRAIFELRWAPAAYTTAAGPTLAQADAGGFLTLYAVDAAADADRRDDSSSNSAASLREIARLECGGGGLGMTTCVDWNPSSRPGGGGGGGSDGGGGGSGQCDLAVCGADGGIRAVALRESGELEVTCETDTAHDLEAWAVAFADPRCAAASGGAFLFSGADDAAFKGWDLRAGLDRPVFVNRRAHQAGVTCVAPSPHDPHAVATVGLYKLNHPVDPQRLKAPHGFNP
jgi:diphthamide biosynthesis protein 7